MMTFKNIVKALRMYSFTASFVPVVLGVVLALYFHDQISWMLVPFVLIAGLSLHAGTNLINDYFDFVNGYDKTPEEGSGVLIEKLMTPKQVFQLAILFFVISISIGGYLVFLYGTPMLSIGVVGVLGGYFYTGKPINYKYYGLGDVCVFILMGPLMVFGSYLAVTGIERIDALYFSIPVGFLVTAILHSNNIRDFTRDSDGGFTTFAHLLGVTNSRYYYIFLIGGAYVFVTILAFVYGYILCLPLVTLPLGIKGIRDIFANRTERIVEHTAKLHGAFGILFIASILFMVFIL